MASATPGGGPGSTGGGLGFCGGTTRQVRLNAVSAPSFEGRPDSHSSGELVQVAEGALESSTSLEEAPSLTFEGRGSGSRSMPNDSQALCQQPQHLLQHFPRHLQQQTLGRGSTTPSQSHAAHVGATPAQVPLPTVPKGGFVTPLAHPLPPSGRSLYIAQPLASDLASSRILPSHWAPPFHETPGSRTLPLATSTPNAYAATTATGQRPIGSFTSFHGRAASARLGSAWQVRLPGRSFGPPNGTILSG
jgi:hypothetical protein